MEGSHALEEAGTRPNVDAWIQSAFQQIRLWGESAAAARLFPQGLASLDLEVGSEAQGRIVLRLVAVSGSAAADSATDLRIMLEGDVEATFNAEGHQIVALISEQDLLAQFPGTMRKVKKILNDGGRTLLEAAIFPDVIKNSHPQTKPFHFVDIPLEEGGPQNPPLPAEPHVISKIAEFSLELKNASRAQEKVDALSWLIHMFGDIHQPLHCAERINSSHPGGDRGGNSFLLKGSPRNLHSLWDSSVSFRNHGDDLELAQAIMAEHPRTALSSELNETDVEKWARASFRLAKRFVYAPLQENPASPPKPSAAYLKKAEQIGRRQAALGAYRLSNRLHELLG